MPSFISHKYKLIFCHIPRTGGTSFYEAIKPYLDKVNIDLQQHTPLRALQIGQTRKIFNEYTKVSIVRDEKDRFESLGKGPPRFNTRPTDDYWWGTKRWLCDCEGNMLADVLLKFEELPGCAIEFLKSIGIEITEFPHLNASK